MTGQLYNRKSIKQVECETFYFFAFRDVHFSNKFVFKRRTLFFYLKFRFTFNVTFVTANYDNRTICLEEERVYHLAVNLALCWYISVAFKLSILARFLR